MATKLSLEEVKKFPYKTLNRLLNKLRNYLKDDDVVKKMFKEYDIDINEIDFVPMKFGDIEVSAKTDHAVIIFNYKLLTDGDFFKDFSYGAHELTHYLQQTCGDKPTQSSNDGSYLDNPCEEEAFQNQVEYIANEFGDGEADKYVDHLLKHHDITDKGEKKEKKEVLLSNI